MLITGKMAKKLIGNNPVRVSVGLEDWEDFTTADIDEKDELVICRTGGDADQPIEFRHELDDGRIVSILFIDSEIEY